MKRSLVEWFIFSALAVAITVLIGHFSRGRIFILSMAWGWGLTLAAAISGDIMCRKAIGAETGKFMLLGVWGSVLRLGVTVIVTWLASYAGMESYHSFLIAVVTGYLVFMAREVIVLSRLNMGGTACNIKK